MIKAKILYNDKEYSIDLYHSWDIDLSLVIDWAKVTPEHKGFYVKFDDCNIYAKVLSATDKVVRTNVGLFKISDVVHCCIPKYRFANYSGVVSKMEHPLVRPLNRGEKSLGTRLANGEKFKFKPSVRVVMNALEKMKARCEQRKIDENYIVDRLIEWSAGNNMVAFNSVKALASIHGVDVNKPQDIVDTSKQLAGGLMGQLHDVEVSKGSMSSIKSMFMDYGVELEEAEVITNGH